LGEGARVRVFQTIAGLRSYLKNHQQNQSIGFVPTMGALHLGHQSLLERAKQETEVVVVSIFVNPWQFGAGEDLEAYPRPWEMDCQLCLEAGVQVLFAPTLETLGMKAGSNQATIVVPPAPMTEVLCGAFRPGHFTGVATIVTKLLQLVQPDVAYFGEKDAQQLAIIRRMVADLHLNVEIRACRTLREDSGLAYSSRNQYLSPSEREKAPLLYQALEQARRVFKKGEREARILEAVVRAALPTEIFRVQYVELVHPESLLPLEKVTSQGLLAVAAYLGQTRLIDNIVLRDRAPIIAIDGPAGAGKSTVTRQVARELGLTYLDTGALYRALTWLVLEAGLPLEDEAAIAELVSQATLELLPQAPEALTQVRVNGQILDIALRTPAVTRYVSAISAQKAVRQVLLEQQRRYGEKGGIVVEGRDIATQVFPNAELKIFLTASVEERAKRRYQDLIAQGETPRSLEEIQKDIAQRDYLDSHRPLSPLRKAPESIEVNTDGLNIAEVTERIISLYRERVRDH
jgi:pantoate ligase/cytidylate kinase